MSKFLKIPAEKHVTYIPKWIKDKPILFERRTNNNKLGSQRKNTNQANAIENIQAIKDKALSSIGWATPVGTVLYQDEHSVYIVAECLCDANGNCNRCDGKGIYPKQLLISDSLKTEQTRKYTEKTVQPPVSFSQDSRGGAHSIREHGRFLSNPNYEEDK